MPDIIFPSVEAIPEELRSFAKEVEGGEGRVVVNLVPNEKLKEFRENNIRVSKEKDELEKIVKDVRRIFPEFDPNSVETELAELRLTAQRVKDGTLTERKDIEEALSQRTTSMKKEYEEQMASLRNAAKNAETKLSVAEQKLRTQAIKQAIVSAAMDEKSGVHPSAVADIVSRALSVFSVENDGERVIPKVGDSVLYGADGTTPMSPGEWIQTLKDNSPHLFRQSSGGGGVGGGGDKRFGGFSEQDYAKLSPDDKLRLANEMSRPKGY